MYANHCIHFGFGENIRDPTEKSILWKSHPNFNILFFFFFFSFLKERETKSKRHDDLSWSSWGHLKHKMKIYMLSELVLNKITNGLFMKFCFLVESSPWSLSGGLTLTYTIQQWNETYTWWVKGFLHKFWEILFLLHYVKDLFSCQTVNTITLTHPFPAPPAFPFKQMPFHLCCHSDATSRGGSEQQWNCPPSPHL